MQHQHPQQLRHRSSGYCCCTYGVGCRLRCLCLGHKAKGGACWIQSIGDERKKYICTIHTILRPRVIKKFNQEYNQPVCRSSHELFGICLRAAETRDELARIASYLQYTILYNILYNATTCTAEWNKIPARCLQLLLGLLIRFKIINKWKKRIR